MLPNFIFNQKLNRYGVAVLMFIEAETDNIINLIVKIDLN